MDDRKDRLTGLSPGKARLFELLRSRNSPAPPDAATQNGEPNSVERQLAEIWRDVLRVRNIKRHDNYFRIGGDSIKSIQIAARARRLGLAVTTRLILENPTIARLAQALTLVRMAPETRPAQQVGRSEYPLTPMQTGLLYETLLAPSSDLYLGCLVLRIDGTLDIDILRLAWNRIFLAHPALRTRIDWTRLGGPRQVVDGDARCDLVVDVPFADEAAEAALQRFQHGLRARIGAIDRAPLCRVGL